VLTTATGMVHHQDKNVLQIGMSLSRCIKTEQIRCQRNKYVSLRSLEAAAIIIIINHINLEQSRGCLKKLKLEKKIDWNDHQSD